MKKIICCLLAPLSIISLAQADDTFIIDINTLKAEALQKSRDKIQDPFALLDIDGNGKLSRRECSGTDESYKYLPFFSESEKADLKQKINAAFDKFDQDKDEYLNQEEAKNYFSYIETLALDMQTQKMDTNGDGVITEDEMTSLMQSMPSMEESMAKLNEMTENLKEINANPQKYVNSTISNVGTAIDEEEFSEMDKDKNGKIATKEYIHYMVNHPNNKDLGFSSDDYREIFGLIDTQNKGYITKQEYIDYNKKQLNDVMSGTAE